jgi:hypothetical protein
MTIRRPQGIAALLVAAGLGLSGCAAAQGAATTNAAEEPATLQEGEDGAPGIVKLSEAAEKRLAIKTAPVSVSGPAVTVPYSAVVYEPDGSSWAYVQTEPLTYQREQIAIGTITGDQATLTSGPAAGALVVTQGAAELVGVETGIDGEE